MIGLSIIPECYVDTCLTETITSCYNQFNHQKGCNTVIKIMKEKFGDRFALGIIDKDKRENPYLQEFELIGKKESLLLLKHRYKHHYFIQIKPAIEGFFLKAATDIGVDVKDYGIPDELRSLTKKTKQISSKNEQAFKDFKRLFRDISSAPEFTRLADLILYLKDNTFRSNVDDLKLIIHR